MARPGDCTESKRLYTVSKELCDLTILPVTGLLSQYEFSHLFIGPTFFQSETTIANKIKFALKLTCTRW